MARKKATAEELQLWQTAPPVEFATTVGDANQRQASLIAARQTPGYPVAAGQIGHALLSRATQMLLDFSQQAVAMRYQVDGIWETLPPLPRETGDPMLAALKQLSGLNPADRRNPQSGGCVAKVKKDKYDISVQSQGIASGERVLVRLTPQKVPFARLEDLGMRDKMQESFRGLLNASGGLVVISAPKGLGLTTTWNVAVEAADRLVRDFQSLEPEERPEPEIINVNPNFYGGSTGVGAHERLRKIFLKEPDVILLPEIPDVETLQMALEQTKANDKHTITRLVAGDAVEAAAALVGRFRAAAKPIAEALTGVLNQRLARRLCETCKEGFEPSPQLLQRLGIPAGRVPVLFRPYVPPPIEQQVDEKGRPAPIPPCPACGGRGYLGRIAIFELLQPGPQFRSALLKTQDLAQLRQIAKNEGHRGLQSEAVLTVARGLTSLDELKRVFSGK